MPVIHHDNVPHEPFRGGAAYQTVVGDDRGSTPVRLGIQTSPPGYRTPLHSHPYMEVLTVLEGAGEAWIEGSDALVAMAPGMTLVFPAHVRHQFRTLGTAALKTLGVHASPDRVVIVHEDNVGVDDGRPVGPSHLSRS
ncbi:MAG: cupin domain-containing protein [Hyphomicrobiales bacterium]|nr:cupin domain-containing protein [Alphaproteobacteria bacterium]